VTPLEPPRPPRTEAPDSFTEHLTGVARSRTARSLVAKAWPYLLALLTAAASWIASKADSKAELAQAVAVQAELLELKQLVTALDTKLFATDPQQRGRVTQLERGQYFAWRALSEVRAAAYAAETAKKRAAMEQAGAKFAIAFDKRAAHDPPEVAYEELFTQVAVP
jgi:hypothetical protein